MQRMLTIGLLFLGACSDDDDDPTSTPRDSGPLPMVDGGPLPESDAGTTPGDDPAAAEAALFTAMNEGDYASVDEIIGRLDALHEAHPENGRVTFLLGIANLWKVAEDTSGDPSIAMTHGPAAVAAMSEAAEVDPDPAHVGFLGIVLFDFGFQIGNPDFMAQGEALIEMSAEALPEFGLFTRMLAYRQLPTDDPRFAVAVESYWDWLDLCIGAEIDRTNPDLTPYLTPDLIATFTGARRFCWETVRVPNAAKGAYFFGGDVLIKAGEVEAARVMYENARLVEGYESWPFRDVLESRLTGDLEARAEAYGDPDPTTHPEQGAPPYSCTVCHQRE